MEEGDEGAGGGGAEVVVGAEENTILAPNPSFSAVYIRLRIQQRALHLANNSVISSFFVGS